MLTAWFGESGGGFFHTLQKGAQEAFAPLESGADRALKPFRDLVGWFGDTFDAKDENKKLQGRERGPAQAARRDRTARATPQQLRGARRLTRDDGLPARPRSRSARG